MSKEVIVVKPLVDLKLKEPLNDIYVYMDYNKKTIEPYYNDEIPLLLNLQKVFQKKAPNIIYQSKKFFELFKDVSISYDKTKLPDSIVIKFELH